MTTWHIILIPIGLLVIGLIRQVLILRDKNTRLALADEFLGRFVEWFNSKGENHAEYTWLLENSDIVQAMLGRSGVAAISDRLSGICAENWPIVLNGLAEINHTFSDPDYGWLAPMVRRNVQLAQYVENSLHRFIGSTGERIRRERTRLFNPLVLFCGGVAWMMELPLFVLSETKIISAGRRTIIVNGRAFSMVSGIVALTALAGTVITIVTGWQAFLAIVTRRTP